jgi:uncharacterized protein (DUF1330 family)
MKQATKPALSWLAGFAPGTSVMQALQAQGVKEPAYVIADVQVTDGPAFQAYTAKVPDTLKPYNARIIVQDKPGSKEGAAHRYNIAMMAFESVSDAEKWFRTAPYSELIPQREKATKTQLYVVEGWPQ